MQEEGVFFVFVSCAGGVTNTVNIMTQWEDAENEALKIEIKGLIGGVVSVAISVAGGVAQSLKTTFVIGGTPEKVSSMDG